jgi:hypothetical protein
MQQPETRVDAAFTKDDFTYVEQELLTVPKEDLIVREIIQPDPTPVPGHHVEFRWYGSQGETALLAAGSKAKDLPIVNMKGGRDTAPMFRIVNIIELDQTDREAIQYARAKGLPVPDEAFQYSEAARMHAEDEQKLFFQGAAEFGKTGILNHADITSEDASLGVTGATDAEKRLAKNKTADELLADFARLIKISSNGGIFKKMTFVGSHNLGADLRTKRLNSTSDTTVMEFLQDKLKADIDRWFFTNAVAAGNNGLAVDSSLLFEASRRVIKYRVPQDVVMLPAIYDVLQSMQQAVVTKTSGCILLQPKAVIRMDGLS